MTRASGESEASAARGRCLGGPDRLARERHHLYISFLGLETTPRDLLLRGFVYIAHETSRSLALFRRKAREEIEQGGPLITLFPELFHESTRHCETRELLFYSLKAAKSNEDVCTMPQFEESDPRDFLFSSPVFPSLVHAK